ncbi:MAG TPA: glycosyltransferase [Solirubrobacteraceae bacterium]|nr:glycosyltransferase [Solirubrobacteraceae bacterium]
MSAVTVAIPVRDGGALLQGTLRALAGQTVEHELLVCDSGSRDGSVDFARAAGAQVLELPPGDFSHGGTRNLLMERASGARVAFLTQDSEPADERWLERLLGGLELAPDVAIAYGPYRPRPGAPAAVRIELERWFASLSPDGRPCVERLDERERAALPTVELVGRRGFFTDSNACVSRTAWERVPFREVAYAEDRVLAVDMLRAGYAKAYVPEAATLHSHRYTMSEQLRRSFDEARALREVYGWREPASPVELVRRLRGELGSARAELAGEGLPGRERAGALVAIAAHHLIRLAGSLLGGRAERLPPAARRRLSLEGRGDFVALGLDRRPAP